MNTEHSELVLNTLKEHGYQLEESTFRDADFIVTPPDAGEPFKLQIWNEFIIVEKNLKRKNMHIAFHAGQSVYCYPHHAALEDIAQKFGSTGRIIGSRSWRFLGNYSVTPYVKPDKNGLYFPQWLAELLQPYRIPPAQNE